MKSFGFGQVGGSGGGGGPPGDPGDFQAVASIAARDAVTPKVVGMVIYVVGDFSYQLVSASPDVWTLYAPHSDAAAVTLTLYVRTTGDDVTGDGTSGNPYLTRLRAEKDIPNFLAQGSFYTIDLTGVNETAAIISFKIVNGPGVLKYRADLTDEATLTAGSITSLDTDPVSGVVTVNTTDDPGASSGFFMSDNHGFVFAMSTISGAGPWSFKVGSTAFFGFAPTPGDDLVIHDTQSYFDGSVSLAGICAAIQFEGIEFRGLLAIAAENAPRFMLCRFAHYVAWYGGDTSSSLNDPTTLTLRGCVFSNPANNNSPLIYMSMYGLYPIMIGCTFIQKYAIRSFAGVFVQEAAVGIASIFLEGISAANGSNMAIFLCDLSGNVSAGGGSMIMQGCHIDGGFIEVYGRGFLNMGSCQLDNASGGGLPIVRIHEQSNAIIDSFSGTNSTTSPVVSCDDNSHCVIPDPTNWTITTGNGELLSAGGLSDITLADFIALHPEQNYFDFLGDGSQIIGGGFENLIEVEPATLGSVVGFTAGVGTPANDDSTYTGGTGSSAYTVDDIVAALKALKVIDL